MSLPSSIYKRMPCRLPYSLGFKRYAMYFDGVDDYIHVPNTVDTLHFEKVTYEALFMMYSIKTLQMIINKQNAAVGDLRLTTKNGKLEAELYDGTAHELLGVTPLSTYRWYHGAITYDGSVARLYLNGELENEVALNITLTNSGMDVYIGCYAYNPANSTYIWDGLIALARIYNRALTEEEIRYNMLNYHNPVRDGLVLWLHDRITSDTWFDESGYGNNGTIYGAVRRNLRAWEIRAEVGL